MFLSVTLLSDILFSANQLPSGIWRHTLTSAPPRVVPNSWPWILHPKVQLQSSSQSIFFFFWLRKTPSRIAKLSWQPYGDQIRRIQSWSILLRPSFTLFCHLEFTRTWSITLWTFVCAAFSYKFFYFLLKGCIDIFLSLHLSPRMARKLCCGVLSIAFRRSW